MNKDVFIEGQDTYFFLLRLEVKYSILLKNVESEFFNYNNLEFFIMRNIFFDAHNYNILQILK